MNEVILKTESREPMTAAQIRAQVNLIQGVMKEVMKKNVHYGIISGCKKPSLYKPGAEKLASTFRLAVEPQVIDLSTTDEIRYRINARMTSIVTGNFVGSGVGECSSNEEKYMWRKAVCDEEFEETPEDRRREKWIKPYNGSAYKVKQVRMNVSDMANTVLKMAKKRAQIDGILTCTAASDIFDQDIEDLPEEYRQEEQVETAGKPPVSPPKSNGNGFISQPQINRLLAISRGAGYSNEDVQKFIAEKHGLNSIEEISKGSQYEEIVNHFQVKKGD